MNYWCYGSRVGQEETPWPARYFQREAVHFWRSPKEKWNQMTRGLKGVSKKGNTVYKVKAMYCLANNVNVGA